MFYFWKTQPSIMDSLILWSTKKSVTVAAQWESMSAGEQSQTTGMYGVHLSLSKQELHENPELQAAAQPGQPGHL